MSGACKVTVRGCHPSGMICQTNVLRIAFMCVYLELDEPIFFIVISGCWYDKWSHLYEIKHITHSTSRCTHHYE